MPTKVVMPQLGESVVEGTVVKWLRAEGERIEEFDSLLEVESAKVSTEIPSPASGIVLRILVEDGVTVNAGTIIAWIGEPGEKLPLEGSIIEPIEQTAVIPASVSVMEDTQPAQPLAGRNRDLGFISPVVARLAKDKNVDLYQVNGTGQSGRIMKQDVLNYLEKSGTVTEELQAWETPGEGDLFRPAELQFPDRFVKPEQIEEKPVSVPLTQSSENKLIQLSSMRKSIAAHMVMSKQTSPHVTTVMEADLKAVFAHRGKNVDAFRKQAVRLTYTAYFIAAIIDALKKVPLVNSSWTDQGILQKSEINIGMATSLGEEGLIVPVIKQADRYSLMGLAHTIQDLAEKARSHQLKPDDVQNGTFTITNHGISGSLFATPIINQPQCAILGVGSIQKRVVVVNDAIAIRPMVYLSLTFDHRILDGVSADGFLAEIVKKLENWPD
jgi:2-oxoglutarate dehydrogenase E2 component (dihydrolipoamide succinyltransferase)